MRDKGCDSDGKIVRAKVSDVIIEVRDGVHLSSFRLTDKPALLEQLNSKEIYDTTLTIPHPFLESHAEVWLQKRIEHAGRQVKLVAFAIRDADGNLIGGVGSDSLELGTTHRAEISYWLGVRFWGQGIMTDAVRAYVGYAFRELGLLRLTAHTFEFNVGSARVLEKNGFTVEGRLRKHFRKDGELLDARLYGLLRDDVH
jgi:ribosomal-protein-alanine N-acetyltransferase